MRFSPRRNSAMRRRMADYRLSRRADADLENIALYGIETFGINQALSYRDGLKAGFA